MAEERRSNLIDVSYLQLHEALCGHSDSITPPQVRGHLEARRSSLQNVCGSIFGKPSPESRKKIQSGSVTLPDGVTLPVGEAEEYVLAISDRYQIDEIHAFIFFRSFLYNRGLPPSTKATSAEMVQELVELIADFYYAERLSAIRVLGPLLGAYTNSEDDPLYEIAREFIPIIIPDASKFALQVLDTYTSKTRQTVATNDPKEAVEAVRLSLLDQLALLELFFWLMWGYAPCSGPIVVKAFETAYDTQLGTTTQTLIPNEQNTNLMQDCASFWLLITVEILELESLSEGTDFSALETPYLTSPESLEKIHAIVTGNTNSRFACTYLAWTYALSRISAMMSTLDAIPPQYQKFVDTLNIGNAYVEPLHVQMARVSIRPDVGLFTVLHEILTQSSLFVVSKAWQSNSPISIPNAVPYRSTLKGLLGGLLDLVHAENVPDYEGLLNVWGALYGRSESRTVASICLQYWQYDWSFKLSKGSLGINPTGGSFDRSNALSRRDIINTCRSQFPIRLLPLFKLLRSMTGSGFLDTDPLGLASDGLAVDPQRTAAATFVYHFFRALPTFTQVISLAHCSGPHALYERSSTGSGSATASGAGMSFINLRPLWLPGGTLLPAKSVGNVMSGDGGEYVVVSWQHEHSGILNWYVNRRNMQFSTGASTSVFAMPEIQAALTTRRSGHHHHHHHNAQPLQVKFEEVGMDISPENDESVVTEALDLLRSVIQSNPALTDELMAFLEPPAPSNSTSSAPPDLVQLTTMVLEEALSRSGNRMSKNATSNGGPRSPMRMNLITSTLSVLAALLSNHTYSNRVWLYIRSTNALFGSGASGSEKSYATAALAIERSTGQYTVTLALLNLVQGLLREATLNVQPENTKLQQVKEEVLMRAIRFVHNEIWIEHMGWRYNQLGDRFEIARRIASLYSTILANFPFTPGTSADATQDAAAAPVYPLLGRTILDVLLFKASTSTITPLVASLTSGGQVVKMLHSTRRFGDVPRITMLLDTLLTLARQVLNCKLRLQSVDSVRQVSLLEQALCARAVVGEAQQTKQDPIDVLAGYVKDRDIGPDVPLQAIRLLTTLARSLSVSSAPGTPNNALAGSFALPASSPTTMIGHLANPEAVVSSFISIVQHPYDDPELRNSVWKFISLVVDVEPALGGLFVAGKFRIPEHLGPDRGKGKEKEGEQNALVLAAKHTERNALTAAQDSLLHWKELWDVNPQLLSSVLHFMTVVWEHALEHSLTLQPLRDDPKFWTKIVAVVKEEIGPSPEYETDEYVTIDDIQHSNHHESVSVHAYRTLSKAYAVELLALDIGFHFQRDADKKEGTAVKKPQSYIALEPEVKANGVLADLLSEAAPNPYAPRLHDTAVEAMKSRFPGLSLPQLEVPERLADRTYGDRYAFSPPLLRDRLLAYKSAFDQDGMDDPIDALTKTILSINLNLSLTHAQTTLSETWEMLLRQSTPFLRSDRSIRTSLIAIAASISAGIAMETRGGEMMAAIHGTRLALLLSILEAAWFSPPSTTPASHTPETKSFIELVQNLRSIVDNEAQHPLASFFGTLPNPFHRTLLQLLYFFAKEARLLLNRPKVLNSDQRLTITETTETVLSLVVEALRVTFGAAQNRGDIDLDRDMELLVSVFEQCTKPDISPSSIHWLTKCQETDVMRASLELFVRTDLSGLSDLPLLLGLKHPLYTPHVLLFHMAVVSNPIAAERFAGEGLLAAYTTSSISPAISAGRVDVSIPEVPGERSPAHLAYCSMLAVVATVITALGRHNHYFDAEACGFVQLYGDQISRALSWTVGNTITMPLVEELEQVVNLFYAIAASVPNASKSNPVVDKVLRQINYVITHPNHLASLFEPVTSEERTQHEKTQGVNDPLKRSLIALLVHRMFRLSSNIVGTLVTISKADSVLCGPDEDWPLSEALVVPHSKVVVGEPASLGTLLELGNCSLDILRNFSNRPPSQSLTAPSAPPPTGTAPLDVRQGIITAKRNLETILLYAVTQLTMWLSKPEFEPMNQDTDTEDQAMEDLGQAQSLGATTAGSLTKERRMTGVGSSAPRAGPSMAERLRRGMTGEMASDLQGLLNKSKPVLVKCDEVLGKKDSTDIVGILTRFLGARISGSS
ncbi:nucleoporin subcomplex protein binding to Pom34-domain-containing protein [Coprinopsis sp. MPI-PUGE-AT-0042]|nr:nucleoporin subcomplex protein binding to Pom34-domain-containing protein [Coprinopsis sp. MPI-PUGE-AT-0042]